jgi:hypothetical protein
MAYNYFDDEDSKRIAQAVPQVEKWKNAGRENFNTPSKPVEEVIFCKLMVKDPAGRAGYWSAKEARYNDADGWQDIDKGKKWDDAGGSFYYIRHHSWDDAEVGQIVRAHLIVNTVEGREDWVFTTDVTNPEGLVFYADDSGGTGQAKTNSSWTTKVGCKVLTNAGEATIPAGFQIDAGDSAQVIMTLVTVTN